MDNTVLLSFAGQSITFGGAVFFLTEWIKTQKWFPKEAIYIRLFVAAACVLLNAVGLFMASAPIDWHILLQGFVSYLMATATYEHAPEKALFTGTSDAG